MTTAIGYQLSVVSFQLSAYSYQLSATDGPDKSNLRMVCSEDVRFVLEIRITSAISAQLMRVPTFQCRLQF
jgi:hypothetical protein